jgi:DNA replication protein DnaC
MADTEAMALLEKTRQKRIELGLDPATGRSTESTAKPKCEPTPKEALLCRSCRKRPARSIEVPSLSSRIQLPQCYECAQADQEREAEELAELRTKRDEQARNDRRKRISTLLETVGVNVAEFGHASFTSWNPDPDSAAVEICRSWAGKFMRGERPNLYLFSRREGEAIAPGSGKTFLAVACIRAILLHDTSVPAHPGGVRFVYTPDLFLDIKATFGKDKALDERDVIRSLTRPELLVLDDFGLNGWTDWKVETMSTILNARQGKSTIYTGNYSPAQMAEAAPAEFARISSRLASRCELVTLTGPDRR